MGVVYRALDTNLGRTVAIKVIRPEALGDPERKQRFVQEARTASALIGRLAGRRSAALDW
jgi:eukaryotic-like serine/threonine-protein kinase